MHSSLWINSKISKILIALWIHQPRINNPLSVLYLLTTKTVLYKVININTRIKTKLEIQICFKATCNSKISKWIYSDLFPLKIINLSLKFLKLPISNKAQNLLNKIVIRRKMHGRWVLNLLIFDLIFTTIL